MATFIRPNSPQLELDVEALRALSDAEFVRVASEIEDWAIGDVEKREERICVRRQVWSLLPERTRSCVRAWLVENPKGEAEALHRRVYEFWGASYDDAQGSVVETTIDAAVAEIRALAPHLVDAFIEAGDQRSYCNIVARGGGMSFDEWKRNLAEYRTARA